MADAESLADALAQLGETEYAPLLSAGLEPGRIGTAELERIRNLVLGLAPESEELEFLLWRWDLLNLKALLRSMFGDALPHLSRLGRYAPDQLIAWFNGEGLSLPAIFAQARRAAETAYGAAGDHQLLDAAIDRVYYGYGSGLWESRNSLLAGYWRARIDLTNLRSLARGKQLGFDRQRLDNLLLDGGAIRRDLFLGTFDRSLEETVSWWGQTPYGALVPTALGLRDLAALERASENLLLERVKPAKGVPLGIEPVLGYYLAKEHETRLVNLVLTAKAAGVSSARIKERLRGVYA